MSPARARAVIDRECAKQRSLPFRSTRRERRPDRIAARDLSVTQFMQALERYGFTVSPGGVMFYDRLDPALPLIEGVIARRPELHLRRRATLAKLLQDRARRECR